MLAARVLRRSLISAVGSGALVGLASLGMMVTTADRVVNLVIEPFSLFYLPGIAVALALSSVQGKLGHHSRAVAENHDFSAAFVIWCTFLLYFVLLYWWQSTRRRAPVLTTAARSR